MLNLTTAQIPPEIRNAVIGLFSDPTSVCRMQEAYIKEQRKIQEELVNRQNANKVNEQNNNLQDTTQLENQN